MVPYYIEMYLKLILLAPVILKHNLIPVLSIDYLTIYIITIL